MGYLPLPITSPACLQQLKDKKPGMLDSAKKIDWENHFSIESGKRCSTAIIYLYSPHQEKNAVQNFVSVRKHLKLVKKSTNPIIQCHSCQAYSHPAQDCTGKQCCGICTVSAQTKITRQISAQQVRLLMNKFFVLFVYTSIKKLTLMH